MAKRSQHDPPERLLVVMPTRLGDCMLATATLHVLRRRFPEAHIAAVVSERAQPLIEGLPSLDQQIVLVKGQSGGAFRVGRRVASDNFDTAVVLDESFRAAAMTMMAGIPRRVGYERDGRGMLLTDRLIPRRLGRAYVPTSRMNNYLGTARYLGAIDEAEDHRLYMQTRPADDERAEGLLAGAKGRPVVLISPGGGDPAGRWPGERFAELASCCVRRMGAAVAVNGSPQERDALARVTGASTTELIDLSKAGMNLRLLKSVVRRCSVVVAHDTLPRYLASAAGVPFVTLPSQADPAWTRLDDPKETMLEPPIATLPVDVVADAVAGVLQTASV